MDLEQRDFACNINVDLLHGGVHRQCLRRQGAQREQYIAC